MAPPRSRNPIDQDPDDEMRMRQRDDDDDGGDDDDDEDDRDGELGDGAGDDDGDPDDDEALDALGLGQVVIGDPFAITGDVALVEAKAVVQHEDGRKFRIDLLRETPSKSPHTGQKYTHVLIVAPVDDTEIIGEAVREILSNNGITGDQLEQAAGGGGRERDDDEEIPPAR